MKSENGPGISCAVASYQETRQEAADQVESSNNRVLVLFAHPSPDRSEVSMPLFQASSGREGVTLVDLYGEYPDYRINIDREQSRLRDHDVIVFMFPLYW